jgi:membrane dipeptidase
MKSLACFVALCILSCTALAESITLSGTVQDKNTLVPLDSVRIDIINASDPAEHYTVLTNTMGLWSYTFSLSGVTSDPAVPAGFSVGQNYPNPFNPSTRINFTTGSPGTAVFTVHNSLGQLLDEKSVAVSAGTHSLEWTGKGAAGVLFYTVEFGGMRMTRKMVQLDGHGAGGLGNVVTFGGTASGSVLAKRNAANYSVIASKLMYMPDTVTSMISSSAVVNFALETVHSRAFVMDLHNDVMEIAVLGGYDLGVRHTIHQSDLPRFRDGGMDAQMFAVWTDWTDSVAHPYYKYTLAMIDSFKSQVQRNSSVFAQAKNYDELMAVHGSGKFAGVLAVEGGHSIENSLDKLRNFYDLGARYMTITWNNSTSWAVSAEDSRSSTVGLSDFGKQVVRTMDSLGMIIDVAHTGIKTIWDILATVKGPIIDSHAGVRALNNHYRNLNDQQIDSIAARGGVIGVVFYSAFLSSTGHANIDTVIKHIDYIKNRVGIDYVAIGSDWDGGITTPVGLEDVSKLPNLTAALLRHGYSIPDVMKILGGNYLRVFKQIVK